MGFLKRLAHTIGDFLTSKKALAAAGSIVAGVDPRVVIAGYLIGQGVADHGKGKAHAESRVVKMHTDRELADKLAKVREGSSR